VTALLHRRSSAQRSHCTACRSVSAAATRRRALGAGGSALLQGRRQRPGLRGTEGPRSPGPPTTPEGHPPACAQVRRHPIIREILPGSSV
jgi:hypothetical protein